MGTSSSTDQRPGVAGGPPPAAVAGGLRPVPEDSPCVAGAEALYTSSVPVRSTPLLRRARLPSIRPLPAAAMAGLALLLLAPGLYRSSTLPASDVLGALGTPAPTSRLDAASREAAARERFAPRPDPGTGDRDPARRLAPDPAALRGYAWPLQDARLTLPYGPSHWGSRIQEGVHMHDGLDLATRCGDRITAAHEGVVLAAGRDFDEYMGWAGDLTAYRARLDAKGLWPSLPIVIVIDDGNGYRSVYAHFQEVTVAAGDLVAAGDPLGYEGMTGRATGCHLHYTLFSPHEPALIGLDPVVASHMLLPTEMVARIDPLRVLPPLEAAGIH